jgi:hypothetical protein
VSASCLATPAASPVRSCEIRAYRATSIPVRYRNFVDATLSDGSRLHVVIPDITRDHWHVNVRKFVVRADHLDDLVRLGTLSAQAARFLEASVVAGLNILVAGGTQAGKTACRLGHLRLTAWTSRSGRRSTHGFRRTARVPRLG